MYIRIKKIKQYVKILNQVFKNIAATGTAAAMQENEGPPSVRA